MQLAIFDIDGTLTNSSEVDALCFVQAFAEEFGVELAGRDWSNFTCVTDAAITRDVFVDRFARLPSDAEVRCVHDRFMNLLRNAVRANPHACVEVPGAAATLEKLRGHPQWDVAIATGSWRASGMFKLDAARVPFDGLPFAAAEDGRSREEIVGAARRGACALNRRRGYDRVVSVGDGVWDVDAARALNVSFVGVSVSGDGSRLRQQGAHRVLRDLSDLGAVLSSLSEAQVPSARQQGVKHKSSSG